MDMKWKPQQPETYAIGRNGYIKARGLRINAYETHIAIFPINSKGEVTNCLIDIPRSSLSELISILEKIDCGGAT